MPYFLYECFKDGCFAYAFQNSDDIFKKWVKNENLLLFFNKGICTQENILDLAETMNVKNGVPKDLEILLNRYIYILETRGN